MNNLKRLALRVMIALNIISVPDQGTPQCINPAFEEEVAKYIVYAVPTISVADAHADMEKFVFLDAREQEEYDVSHIPQAKYIGYDDFDFSHLDDVAKDQPIVIYCSIGYRSEKIGEKLKKAGYTDVHNLYGSIFEWVNQHYPIVNALGSEVHKLHTYNKKWSKWVQNSLIEKVY